MEPIKNIINAQSFFKIIEKEEVSKEEQNKVEQFQEIMGEADRYRDYLVGTLKATKDTYENRINQLAMLEAMNPGSGLTTYQKIVLAAYDKQKSNALEAKENKIKKLEKRFDVSAGYTSSIALILAVLTTGILMGVVIYFIK